MGGLAAGCYGQVAGYETTVFEAHRLPGGVCTSWKRQGFVFDGCLHHLPGCNPDSGLYELWQDLGVFPRRLLFPEDLVRAELSTGQSLTVYTDLARLEQELRRLAPEDGRAIGGYLRAVRTFKTLELFEIMVRPGRSLLAILPRFPRVARLASQTMAAAASEFRNPFLRKVFPSLMYDRPETPLLIHCNMLAGCTAHRIGWPVGGSLALARSIETRYRELGGTLLYSSRVDKILTENGKAIGVRLADGTEHRADNVIVNAYAHTAVFRLLEGRYVDETWRRAFAAPEDKVTMGLHVSLGVNRDLANEAHAIVLWLLQPITIAGESRDRLDLELFGFDPTMAPSRKGVLKVVLDTSWSYWAGLATDRGRYDAEKKRILEAVIQALGARFPGLESQVEAADVATPLTTERYTGGAQTFKQPSSAAWMIDAFRARPKGLPGLRNLYFVGQWVGGAGLSGCAIMGRNAILQIKRHG
jgi:phytoene dehydrogenase-like protein